MNLQEGLSNDVNIVNVTKHNFAILIRLSGATGLIASAFQLLGSCIKQWSSIVNLGETNLIFFCTIAEADPAN